MKKNIYLLAFVAIGTFAFSACGSDDNNDDGTNFVAARDRGEEEIASTLEVEEYLQTHFYNYEDFISPPADFDFKIKFDTIAGDNSDKIALINQVDSKIVQDRINESVQYKLYYLVAKQGDGEKPDFPDITRINYEGIYISNEEDQEGIVLFDSSVIPVQFDLTQIVNGLQDALTEFNAGTGFVSNPDGTVEYENFGVGAVFMQSGLGYFVSPPAGSAVTIPLYSQLIFSFQLFETEVGDQDGDGIPSVMEDVNGNGLEEDDNTDGDALVNYIDADDDGDGRPTADEIIINDDGSIIFPDEDGDGVVDYLDSDS